MRLKDLSNNLDLVNAIDWEMTPEDAVTMYLEWGNNPALGNRSVRSKDDSSTYFVVNTWHRPVIYLMYRNSEEAVELAQIDIPARLKAKFLDSIGYNKGVYAIDADMKRWLKKELQLH